VRKWAKFGEQRGNPVTLAIPPQLSHVEILARFYCGYPVGGKRGPLRIISDESCDYAILLIGTQAAFIEVRG
jgi:hypothetical protein